MSVGPLIFLSHNSADKVAVEEIARRLRSEGLEPWLDSWHLVPGEKWQPALEKALYEARVSLVFFGPSGAGPWQDEEMRVAIARRVSDPSFRVIPVLLPGAERGKRSSVPPFLATVMWVEFQRSLSEEASFRRLLAGIAGKPPVPPVEFRLGATNPYRGLHVFDVADRGQFFGRDALLGWLVSALRASLAQRGDVRLLALVGASGSGKSSLARAGLVATLQQDGIDGSRNWRYVILKPGGDPIESLAGAASGALGLADAKAVLTFQKDLCDDARILHTQAALATRDAPPGTRLVLLIDQLEELFTLCKSESRRQAFIDNLLYAASAVDGPIIVIATLRADFVGRCAVYERLATALSDHQELVGPMRLDELRDAIERPALLSGCTFEAGLVKVLLDEVVAQPGALPLLQHALFELWRERDGASVLTHDAYERIGRVQGALARRADKVYGTFAAQEQEVARRILLRLTQPGEGTEDSRRRAPRDELISSSEVKAVVERVVERMVDERLLVTEGGTVDVAHEFLIRNWPALRDWVDSDREGLREHRRLTLAAEEWRRLKQDPSALYSGLKLELVLAWSEDSKDQLNELEGQFIEESKRRRACETNAIRAQEEERESLRQKDLEQAKRITQESMARLTAERERATETEARLQAERDRARESEARIDAERKRLEAEQAKMSAAEREREAKLEAELARSAAAERDKRVALDGRRRAKLLLALAALSTVAFAYLWRLSDQRLVSSGKAWIEQARMLLANDRPFAAFSASGMVLNRGPLQTGKPFLSAESREFVEAQTIFEIASLSSATPVTEYHHNTNIYSLDVSPDGEFLATGGKDQVTVRRVASGDVVAVLSGHGGFVQQVRFLGASDRLISADLSGRVAFWNISGSHGRINCLQSTKGSSAYVYGVDYSARARLVAVGDGTGTISLWTEEGAWVGSRPNHKDEPVTGVAFDRAGKVLFTGGKNGTLASWEVSSGAPWLLPLQQKQLHEGVIFSVAVNKDDAQVVSAGEDRRVQRWKSDLTDPKRELERHASPLWNVSFHDDLNLLITSARDKVVRLFDVETTRQVAAIDQNGGWVYRTIVAGSDLFSASEEGTVRRFSLSEPLRSLQALPSDGEVIKGSFSPDGEYLAVIGRSAGTDRLTVWALAKNAVARRHCTRSIEGAKDVSFSADSRIIVATESERERAGLLFFDPQTCQPTGNEFAIPPKIRFHAIARAVPAPFIAALPVASKGGARVVVVDATSGQVVVEGKEHENDTKAIAFHPGGSFIATGDAKGKLFLWKFDGPARLLKVQQVLEFSDYPLIKALSFSPDGKWFALGSEGGQLLLYKFDGSTLSDPKPLELHTSMVNAIAFSGDSKRLVAGADDKRMTIWEVETRRLIRNLGALTGIGGPFAFHPKLNLLAFDGGGGITRLWDLDAGTTRLDTEWYKPKIVESASKPGLTSVRSISAESSESCTAIAGR